MSDLLGNARKLRRNQTEAEKRLWALLRGNRLDGWKFKRQQPLGPYIADFVCFQARLVIEADGGQHAGSVADEQRDAWLKANGFRVLRFWNNDILSNTDGVVLRIAAALAPPPSRGREGPAP